MSMVTMVAAATNIAKSARSRVREVRAGRDVRAAVVAAALESESESESEATSAEQESAPSLFRAKARDARRPTRDANPRNPAGNIVYSPFLAPRISWQPPTRCKNPFHAACSSLFLSYL